MNRLRCCGGVPAALMLGALVCVGCDLGSMAYFLTPEAKVPPVCKLASPDKKKEVKVVILAHAPNIEMDLAQCDRQLAELLAKRLHDQFEENEEKVTLIPPRKVEEYKSTHPEWLELPPADIGRHFKADFVISLEINDISLYEKGSGHLLSGQGGMMYRGRTDMTVTLIDVKNADEAPQRHEVSCVYPSEARGPMDADGVQPLYFRLKFLDAVAKRLTRYFAAYSSREAYDMETEYQEGRRGL